MNLRLAVKRRKDFRLNVLSTMIATAGRRRQKMSLRVVGADACDARCWKDLGIGIQARSEEGSNYFGSN